MSDAANHIFLPWVAPAISASFPEDVVAGTSNLPAVFSPRIKLVVSGSTIEKTAKLYGPGDIASIDPQQIIRLDPPPGTTDFEPNYFPAIEFDRPDFPWLFTPARANAANQLRPWLCLVVIEKQAGVTLRARPSQALPVLEIRRPARPRDQLPELAEAHFWAHAQVTGSSTAALKQSLESQPTSTLSRLLCARRLSRSTDYIACLVPTFQVGVRAGLDAAAELPTTLAPAWASGDAAPEEITLPVYFSWEFRTGAGGDFEELVRRLEPHAMPADVGKRPIDLAHSGLAADPPLPPTTLRLEGALRVIDSQADVWPDAARQPFQAALAAILNAPWQLATKPETPGDPVVASPLYGCWYAGVHQVPQAGGAPATWPPAFWLDELNLDPRQRAIAALGTAVVQEQQEPLMASAWQQLGAIATINQQLRQAQLSRAANERYHAKTFDRLSPEALLRIAAPAAARLALDNTASSGASKSLLAKTIADSFVPATTVSPALRKLARPRGAINRRLVSTTRRQSQNLFEVFNEQGNRAFRLDRDRGAVSIDRVSQTLEDDLNVRPGYIWVEAAGGIDGHWERVRVGYREMLQALRLANLGEATIAALPLLDHFIPQFRVVAAEHHAYLARVTLAITFVDLRFILDAGTLKISMIFSMLPRSAVTQATQASLTTTSAALQSGDPLDPIMDAPVFPQPMYEALRELSQDYLFPGLEHVPANSVQLLQTNAKFIESFMIGLNAELGRELLWRGYPTDQRGTYFQYFWDAQSATGQPQPDITPIHQWGSRALGATAVGAGADKLVLLIRGQLLRRYPGTIIFASKAVVRGDQREPSTRPEDEAHPVFRGSLEPDVAFLGFDLKAAEMTSGEGWFFVFQQQPTEPRFGLDDDPFGAGESGVIPELETWNDLNWAHLAPTAQQLLALSHVPVAQTSLEPSAPDKGKWGRNSAHMAHITRQRLVRIAIHATRLLT